MRRPNLGLASPLRHGASAPAPPAARAAAPVPPHLAGFNRSERRAYYARTTPDSRKRLYDRVTASHQPAVPGTYHEGDFFVPEIDQARRASRRGAEDLIGAGGLEGGPIGGDYGTQLRRENEDYQLGLTNIGRRYDQQGVVQQGEAAAAGLGQDQGTIAASAAARSANKGLDVGALTTDFTRHTEDTNTLADRVRREYASGNFDLDQSETAAANQAGYVPPNAFTPPPRIAARPRSKKKKGRR